MAGRAFGTASLVSLRQRARRGVPLLSLTPSVRALALTLLLLPFPAAARGSDPRPAFAGSGALPGSEEGGKESSKEPSKKEEAKGGDAKGEGSGGGKEQGHEGEGGKREGAAGGEPKKAPGKAEEEARPVVDEAKVYFGKAHCCKAPAVVDAERLFRAIPEYRKILDDKLTDADPKYSVLLLKATRKFKAGVEKAASDGSHDLVAAVGSVTWPNKTVPDITATALLKIEEAERAAR
jgi:hypothetical protein